MSDQTSGDLIGWVAKAQAQADIVSIDALKHNVDGGVGMQFHLEQRWGDTATWEPCTFTAMGAEAGYLVARANGELVGQCESKQGETVSENDEAMCSMQYLIDAWGQRVRPPQLPYLSPSLPPSRPPAITPAPPPSRSLSHLLPPPSLTHSSAATITPSLPPSITPSLPVDAVEDWIDVLKVRTRLKVTLPACAYLCLLHDSGADTYYSVAFTLTRVLCYCSRRLMASLVLLSSMSARISSQWPMMTQERFGRPSQGMNW